MGARWWTGSALSMLAVLAIGGTAAAGGWTASERVGAGGDAQMAVAPSGRLDVVVRGEDGLWHLVRRPGGGWTQVRLSRDVDRDAGNYSYREWARSPSIARDPASGALAMAAILGWYDGGTGGCNHGLFLRRSEGTHWSPRERVRFDAVVGNSCPTSVSVAWHAGRIHLAVGIESAYLEYKNAVLLTETAGGWRRTVVRPTAPDRYALQGPQDPVLAMDAQGRAHIAYRTPHGIHHAVNSGPGGAFVRTRIARTGGILASLDLALDSRGRPSVAWVTDEGTLLGRLRASDGWSVSRAWGEGSGVALAIDGRNRPQLLIAGGADGPTHARRVNGDWLLHRLDDRSSRGAGDLGIDRTGTLAALWQRGRTDVSPTLWLNLNPD